MRAPAAPRGVRPLLARCHLGLSMLYGGLPERDATARPRASGRRSRRRSRPSQSSSTSALCWPRSGEGLTRGGLPSTRTGQVGILNAPVRVLHHLHDAALLEASDRSAAPSCRTPRRPARPTPLISVIASSLVCWRVHSVTIASTSASRSAAGGAGGEARVVDQLLAPDQPCISRAPVLGIGAARDDVDVVVGADRLALIEAGGRVGAGDGSCRRGAAPPCRCAPGSAKQVRM